MQTTDGVVRGMKVIDTGHADIGPGRKRHASAGS